jgi:hypothetical protein
VSVCIPHKESIATEENRTNLHPNPITNLVASLITRRLHAGTGSSTGRSSAGASSGEGSSIGSGFSAGMTSIVLEGLLKSDFGLVNVPGKKLAI